uniref:Uncharacterized protein n=1 Tax=Anguilla anguilla TaxID=7936 RepID=A0A0E9SAF5_ANGAN
MMVLALVFVRKLMDLCFTNRELSWLDDLMPESKKRKEDDQKKMQKQTVADHMLETEQRGLAVRGQQRAEHPREDAQSEH